MLYSFAKFVLDISKTQDSGFYGIVLYPKI